MDSRLTLPTSRVLLLSCPGILSERSSFLGTANFVLMELMAGGSILMLRGSMSTFTQSTLPSIVMPNVPSSSFLSIESSPSILIRESRYRVSRLPRGIERPPGPICISRLISLLRSSSLVVVRQEPRPNAAISPQRANDLLIFSIRFIISLVIYCLLRDTLISQRYKKGVHTRVCTKKNLKIVKNLFFPL